MSVLRVIQGLIAIKRPPAPLGYFAVENDYAPGTQTFVFGALRRDVIIQNNYQVTVKFDGAGNNPVVLGAGTWTFANQWSQSVIVTFSAASTHLSIYANG